MSQPAYLNFDIQILARLDGTFRARVAAIPLKMDNTEPSAIFSITRHLQNLLERFHSEASHPANETLVYQLGNTLFHALFNRLILDAYRESLSIAHEKSRYGLRIRLNLEQAPQLSHIPWELMHTTRDFLVLSPKTSLIRYPRQIVPRRHETLLLPLRVLFVLSNPDGVLPLDFERERRLFETATNAIHNTGKLTTDILENPTSGDLFRQLKTSQYHALHFSGPTQADPETNSGYLILSAPNDDTAPTLVRVDTLARQITEENRVRLVFLDSTYTPASASIVASNFIARGLPALIMPQFPMSSSAYIQLIAETYRTITEYDPIDEAIARTRRAIRSQNPVDWASPILYNHSANGLLFSRPARIVPLRTYRGIPLRLWLAAGGIISTLLILLILVAIIGTDDILANDEDDQSQPSLILNVELRVNSITFNPTTSEEDMTLHVQIENIGTEPSPTTSYELRLNHASLPTTQLSDEIPPISPNETIEIEMAIPIQESGVFLAQIILDSDNQLNETNEYNNIRSIPLIISPSTLP